MAKRMDELARRYAETHEPSVKAELEGAELSTCAPGNSCRACREDALQRCRREEVRSPEVYAALDELEARAQTKWPFAQFREALNTNQR
jgi:hypothetical protein